MRILVTGARSFTARYLLPLLASRGEVFATDVMDDAGGVANYTPANMYNREAVETVVKKAAPDVVFHLAGTSRGPEDIVLAVNFGGVRNLFGCFWDLAKPPRLLMVSTAAVYGRIGAEETPVRETAALRPVGPYGLSKAIAEKYALERHQNGRADVIIVRPFNLIGPGLRPGLAPSDFLAEIKRVKRGEGEPVIRAGNLEPRRDFVDVRDAVRAYVLLAENPDAYGQTFNVGSGRPTAIGELLERMITLSGVNVRVETDPSRWRDIDVPEMVADISALRRVAGWFPRVSLDQSLTDMIEET
jgi:GDP-4-dehydro-6-deoxy-D-mannose reductase